MAPIVKETDSTVATTTTSAPAAPALKSPNETPTRPQPVALEIPVTVNGARTVDGSDKREPFSETTQTVLVFAHGAVVRVTTPLVSGQLIFLTNEKTKKEVVCQVVKSKSSGSASGYVELQFTEPAPGFWGLRMPSAPVTPSAPPAPLPRPAAPAAPTAPKAISPAPPLEPKPVVPKPDEPVATAPPPAPAQPTVIPTPSPVLAQPEPVSAQPAVPTLPTPPVSVPPPPVAVIPEPPPVRVLPPAPVSTLPAAISTDNPTAPDKHTPPVAPPALRDYSKEIDALFSSPQAPTSHPAPSPDAEHKVTPASSSPSSEELKLQAARLQAQLGSMLFTESAAVPPSAPAPPATSQPGMLVPDVAKKVLETAHEEPKPVVKTEPKPAPPVHKPILTSHSAEDEEVKIPSWLAPLSYNSEPSLAEPPASSSGSMESSPETSAGTEESSDIFATESYERPQAAVFGGQLLDESSAQGAGLSSSGSKKGLFLGLAAAAVLVAGGGFWYFHQSPSGTSSTVASVKPLSAPPSASLAPASNPLATHTVSTPAPQLVNPAPASPQPVKNSEHVTSPAASPAPAERKTSNPAPQTAVEPEPPNESPLGEVHLAAPVVNRGRASQQSSEALPSIDGSAANPGGEAFSALASSNQKQPAAPLPVGGEVTPAQLIKSVPPVYPQLAKSQRISGNVQIDALIDASGNVAGVKVLSGPGVLHLAALEAVKQWKYKPALLDGQPTSVHLTITVQFRNQ
ncbi:MAG TPA: TonB family protein [Candidatus Sulfotelmatobacter sp.]|nr:TonB family protein [Candidatus Sulfotelmatobacter sp.]